MTDIPRSAAFDAAIQDIELILGPRVHPDVERIIDVVAHALDAQAAFIAQQARREATAYKRGERSQAGNQQLTYDGGLRRAARIADAQGAVLAGGEGVKPKRFRFAGDVMSAPHDVPQL